MTPYKPSFQTVVGPFLWRFGSVTNPVPAGPPDEAVRIAALNRGRVERDDLEILEILTTISQCLR